MSLPHSLLSAPGNHSDDVLRARRGDDGAFLRLLQELRPVISSLCRRYFGPGASRDDFWQEAIIGLFKAVRDFNSRFGGFEAFAELCVQRQLISYIKALNRHKHRALNCALSLDAPVSDDSDETWSSRFGAKSNDGEYSSDLLDRVRTLHNKCSRYEKTVLLLYSQGYSSDEMAKLTGKSLKSVGNTVWRIKVKARHVLADASLRYS